MCLSRWRQTSEDTSPVDSRFLRVVAAPAVADGPCDRRQICAVQDLVAVPVTPRWAVFFFLSLTHSWFCIFSCLIRPLPRHHVLLLTFFHPSLVSSAAVFLLDETPGGNMINRLHFTGHQESWFHLLSTRTRAKPFNSSSARTAGGSPPWASTTAALTGNKDMSN